MITWPASLVSDLAWRRSVVVLGSGVSMNSINGAGRRPKSWLAFLESLMGNINPNRHIRTLLHDRDYLTACEVLKNSMTKDNFNDALRDEYLHPGYSHSQLHESIIEILTYNPAANHQELNDSVAALVSLVEVERENLRESGNW